MLLWGIQPSSEFPSASIHLRQFISVAIGALGSKAAPPQGTAKIDTTSGAELQTWMPAEYDFCGEPIFAPSTAGESIEEDDGYIITILYNDKDSVSEMVILSANDLCLYVY